MSASIPTAADTITLDWGECAGDVDCLCNTCAFPFDFVSDIAQRAAAGVPSLHVLSAEAVVRGIEYGDTALPTRSRKDVEILKANAAISKAILKEAGFEKTSGVVAGINSGSSWFHHGLKLRAEIAVRRWNVLTVEG